ncbi:ribulose-5-phosphate 4-epimerase [Sphingobium jiangsuense]|uniref:Ribulose-5-phosphate 4-epimerase/fuculose-1-phosphate aldolase n=1 Tax=Sphingobium jiangsuense TaxID=870476 RepID=A0A7W6BFQ1_9SPHN|nr:class II aldolase/adducin family protein [Sphingobium jiangsuense]MBB3926058.1 ribulose-5-phosphate 4-epimerase/fuculose-1-phosphate aldolase [Sphingobium jiangsuense]GLT00555.1 ribulose-5-phosphate 4-epimerase [Sphingobium jiangsuense]
MTDIPGLSKDAIQFVANAEKDARKAFRLLRETHTISASGTLGFALRIPGEDKIVTLSYAGLWEDDPDQPRTSVLDFDGRLYWGEQAGGEARYLKLFRKYPDFRAISHVHTPHLGAYSQAHSELPLLYVPNRRFRFTAQLPVYINRRQPEPDFILDAIEADREVPGIVEANGGATIWSWKGLRDLVNTIVLLEEGARFQVLAAALGGSKPFGPGVLEQQWKMGKLVPPNARVDDDGTIHLPETAAAEAAE